MEITDSKQGLGLIQNDDLSVGSFHGLNICLGSVSLLLVSRMSAPLETLHPPYEYYESSAGIFKSRA